MERVEFCDPFEIVDVITAMVDDDYPLIAVYGKYDVIKELLEDLIMDGTTIANEIELQDYEVSHYDKEYVLYLSKRGVNVEKTYNTENKRYIYGGGEITLVHDDCNSKLLPYIKSKSVYEFGICDDCNDTSTYGDEDNEAMLSKDNVTYNNDENDDMHGFTATRSGDNSYKSVSFYSSDKLTMKDIQAIMQELKI